MIDAERMNRVRYHLELANSITETKRVGDAASAENKDKHATKIIELAPKAEFFKTKAGYTVGDDLGEFTSSQDFTKGRIAYILWVVYNDKISYAKAKKHHTDKLSEKVSSSCGDNKIRAYLVSASDAVADTNEDKIFNRNGDIITNRNVNMAAAGRNRGGGSGRWYWYW